MRVTHRLAVALLLSLAAHCALAVEPNPPGTPQTLQVLFVGNSLTYVNDLPRLVQAIAAAQPDGPRIATTTFAAPGGSLGERWDDGHAADALRNRHWDALVLQERGGVLICMSSPEHRREPECRKSERAHKQFAELAKSEGARVLLYPTWGPDQSWEQKLARAHDLLTSAIGRTGAQTELVPIVGTLERYATRHSREATFPDGTHPSLSASLIIAAQLYRAISGHEAQAHDVLIDFPLLPANALVKPDLPLESQAQLAGDGKKLLLKDTALAPLLEAAYAPD